MCAVCEGRKGDRGRGPRVGLPEKASFPSLWLIFINVVDCGAIDSLCKDLLQAVAREFGIISCMLLYG